MKTRWLWVILIAAVVALGWASARTTEPQYEGRSLTSWLIAYSEADAEAQREVAARAISHVGTNAIPCLLDKIRYQPGPLKSLLIDAVYRLPEPLCYRGVRLLDHECKLESAAVGFRILGPSARAAVPDLIQLVTLAITMTRQATLCNASA